MDQATGFGVRRLIKKFIYNTKTGSREPVFVFSQEKNGGGKKMFMAKDVFTLPNHGRGLFDPTATPKTEKKGENPQKQPDNKQLEEKIPSQKNQ